MKTFARALVTFLSLSMLSITVNAYENKDSIKGEKQFRLKYIINKAELDSGFMVDNAGNISDIHDFLQEVRKDSLMHIYEVKFRGTASPDGSYEFNKELSEKRLKSFRKLVTGYLPLPDSVFKGESSSIVWDEFRQKVAESNMPEKAEVIAIIDEGENLVPYPGNRHIDERLLKLKKLNGGATWEKLKSPILRDLRYGDASFLYFYEIPGVSDLTWNPVFNLPEAEMVNIEFEKRIVEYETWTPRIYLKTNLIGWALASANLGVEFDLAPHWSLTLPAYYSAVDYFKSTIKFRNITFQPELRYWPNAKEENHGFFVGAHFGMMYYNFAVNGKHRFQDHDGKTPALGGGIGIGYRKAISKNKRWHIEFTAGAGAYKLDYDVFENTPNYKDGPLVYRKKKTFIGLDQLAISITYNFPLTKCKRTYEKGGVD